MSANETISSIVALMDATSAALVTTYRQSIARLSNEYYPEAISAINNAVGVDAREQTKREQKQRLIRARDVLVEEMTTTHQQGKWQSLAAIENSPNGGDMIEKGCHDILKEGYKQYSTLVNQAHESYNNIVNLIASA